MSDTLSKNIKWFVVDKNVGSPAYCSFETGNLH